MSAHATIKCPNCGAPISAPDGAESAVCEYCDCTVQLENASRIVHVKQHIVDEAALKNAELEQEMRSVREEKLGEWKKLLRIWLAAFFGAVLLCWFGDAVNSGGAGFMKVILAGILVLGGGYLFITYPGGLPFVDGVRDQLRDLLIRPLPPKTAPQARTYACPTDRVRTGAENNFRQEEMDGLLALLPSGLSRRALFLRRPPREGLRVSLYLRIPGNRLVRGSDRDPERGIPGRGRAEGGVKTVRTAYL